MTPKPDRQLQTPPVPFQIYTIHEGFEEVVLATATVVRLTPTKWWFDRRGDLGFSCRTCCTPFAHYLTPLEAWEAFRQNADEQRTQAVYQINAADAAIDEIKRKGSNQ